MRISAIVPLYNGERYIEAAIRSVLAQTLKPHEIIVVDDGSTDGGPALVERPVTLLRKANGGQSSARNFGVQHSTGDLIAFLDQDDLWYPNHLAELAKPFLADSTLGWAYSNLDRINERDAVTGARFLDGFPAEHPKVSLARCIAGDMYVLPSAALIRRSAFDAIGGFDERLSGYEDDDLFLRLLCAGYGNAFIDRPLSAWREHDRRATYSPRFMRSGLIYAAKLIETFPDHGIAAIGPRFIRRGLAAYRRAAVAGDFIEAAYARRFLEGMKPHTRGQERLLLTLALSVPRLPGLVRLANAAWPLVRRLLAPRAPSS